MKQLVRKQGKGINSVITAAASVTIALTSVGMASAPASAATTKPVTIVVYPQGSWAENYNPFSPSALPGTAGAIYEPLVQFFMVSGKYQDWLISGFHWSNGNKTLTLNVRKGIKWSNGTPFTANDIMFTFDLMKKYPALDGNAVWQFLNSVSAPNSSTVVFDLKQPDVAAFYYLTSVLPVPQSVWSKIKNPVTYTNTSPVATGPFMLQRFSPQDYLLGKNPDYWRKGQPHVSALSFPAYTSNSSVELALSRGQVDWGSLFAPDIQKTYVATNPAHHNYWFAQGAPVMLFTNDAKYPFNMPQVRIALSYAINRSAVSQSGEYGYELPASALGIPPGQKSYINAAAQSQAPTQYNPQKALAILKSAGFKKNAQGQLLMPNGKPFNMQMLVVAPYSDWVQDVTVMAGELQNIGINAQVKQLQFAAYYSDLQHGTFDTAIGWSFSGPNPYYFFNYAMNSAMTAPVGSVASTNFQRYKSKLADQYLKEYNSTSNPQVQAGLMNKLEQLWVKTMPSIPVVWGAFWNEYSTQNFTGWPTPQNPYTDPGPNDTALELTLLNIRPAN